MVSGKTWLDHCHIHSAVRHDRFTVTIRDKTYWFTVLAIRHDWITVRAVRHDWITVTGSDETWLVHCHNCETWVVHCHSGEIWLVHFHRQKSDMPVSLSKSRMKHDRFTVTVRGETWRLHCHNGFTVKIRDETGRVHCHNHGWNATVSLSKAAVKHDWYMVYCHAVVRQGCFTVTIDLRRDWFKVTVTVRHDWFNVTVDVKHDWFTVTNNVIKTRLAYSRGRW